MKTSVRKTKIIRSSVRHLGVSRWTAFWSRQKRYSNRNSVENALKTTKRKGRKHYGKQDL